MVCGDEWALGCHAADPTGASRGWRVWLVSPPGKAAGAASGVRGGLDGLAPPGVCERGACCGGGAAAIRVCVCVCVGNAVLVPAFLWPQLSAALHGWALCRVAPSAGTPTRSQPPHHETCPGCCLLQTPSFETPPFDINKDGSQPQCKRCHVQARALAHLIVWTWARPAQMHSSTGARRGPPRAVGRGTGAAAVRGARRRGVDGEGAPFLFVYTSPAQQLPVQGVRHQLGDHQGENGHGGPVLGHKLRGLAWRRHTAGTRGGGGVGGGGVGCGVPCQGSHGGAVPIPTSLVGLVAFPPPPTSFSFHK